MATSSVIPGLVRRGRLLSLPLAGAALASCAGPQSVGTLPRSEAAYLLAPPASARDAPAAYRIGPGDVISVTVFQEPDLSNEKLLVGDDGHIQLPLAGEMVAAGKTGPELAGLITERLGQRYIRKPRIAVGIVAPREQTVAVEGQVRMPGVYRIARGDSLLSAIARAQSPTRVARLNEVIVLRTIGGQRTGARFDLRAIRAGRAPDPEVLGGDVIVVGFSALKGVYRDILQAAPLFNVFTQF